MYAWIQKHGFSLWTCVSLILCAVLYVRGIFFFEPDDAMMLAQFAGAYGTGFESWGVPYVSIVLSAPVAIVAQTSGLFVSWAIVELILYCFVFLLFHLAMCKHSSSVLTHLFVLFFEWFMAAAFTYTAIALLLAAAGCLVLTSKHELNRIEFVGGAAGIALGILLREPAGIVGVCAVLPVLALEDKSRLKCLYKIAHILLVSIAVFRIGNALYYASTPELAAYSSWNELSTQIRDGRPRPTNGGLESVGWSENDYRRLTYWVFNDSSTFSTEKMANFTAQQSVFSCLTVHPETIAAQYVDVNLLFSAGSTIFGIMLLLLSLRSASSVRLALTSIIAINAAFVFSLAVIRRLVWRVAIPLCCISCIIMLLIADREKSERRFVTALKWCSAIAMTLALAQFYDVRGQLSNQYREEYLDTVVSSSNSFFRDHPNDLFVYLPARESILFNVLHIDEYEHSYFLPNVCDAGNWNSFSPLFRERLSHFEGVNPDDLLHSIVDNEHVYLAYEESWLGEQQLYCILQWAREHVDEHAELVEIESEMSGTHLYQMRTEG